MLIIQYSDIHNKSMQSAFSYKAISCFLIKKLQIFSTWTSTGSSVFLEGARKTYPIGNYCWLLMASVKKTCYERRDLPRCFFFHYSLGCFRPYVLTAKFNDSELFGDDRKQSRSSFCILRVPVSQWSKHPNQLMQKHKMKSTIMMNV